jgi:hypothetical protein
MYGGLLVLFPSAVAPDCTRTEYIWHMRQYFFPIQSAALLLAICLTLPYAFAQPIMPPLVGVWDTIGSVNGTRTLNFKATARLLDKTVPIALSFFYNAEFSKNSQGAVGFDLVVSDVDKLAAFHFDDFEGPDASTIGRTLLTAKVLRSGQPPLTYSASPSGSYARSNVFTFEVSAATHKPHSTAKSILKALADDNALTLSITIVDPQDAKRALDLVIPVANKRSAFKALMAP